MENRQEPPKRVVVCGGGVIGVCTAYFLSKKGAAVTIVEKSSIACAASGKAGGFLALDWCDGGAMSSLARASFNLHRSLAEELNGFEAYGYRPVTTLSLSVTESSSSSGASYRSPGPSFPSWVNGPAKSPKTIGTTETTAQVHPQLFTRTLLNKAVEEYGAQLVIGKVEKVEVADGRAKSVVLEGGREIDADAIVLALGPWTSKLPLLSSMFRISGLKAHSIVLEPKDPNAITPHDNFFLSCNFKFFEKKGEVYICGMSADAEVPDDPEQIEPVPESIRVLKRVASNVSSHLKEEETTLKAEQACFFPCTDDGVPVIGEVPGVKGCFVATGHSCWGILSGPATGAAMAELVLDGHASVVDLTRFNPSRFVLSRRR